MLHLLLAEEMKLYMTTIASPGPSTAVDAKIKTATNGMRCRVVRAPLCVTNAW